MQIYFNTTIWLPTTTNILNYTHCTDNIHADTHKHIYILILIHMKHKCICLYLCILVTLQMRNCILNFLSVIIELMSVFSWVCMCNVYVCVCLDLCMCAWVYVHVFCNDLLWIVIHPYFLFFCFISQLTLISYLAAAKTKKDINNNKKQNNNIHYIRKITNAFLASFFLNSCDGYKINENIHIYTHDDVHEILYSYSYV